MIGTGQGWRLPTMLVKSHNGQIWFQSEDGAGDNLLYKASHESKLIFISKMKFLFLVCLLFFFGCSEDSQKTENHSSINPELPFPVVRKMEISQNEQKKFETELFKSKFARINPGKFLMGSDDNESGRGQDEVLHEVLLTEPFYISKFETTIHDWNSVYLSRMRNPEFSLNSRINH